MRLRTLSVAAILAVLVTAGCHGAGATKAGGSTPAERKPLTLTMLSGDALWEPEYAAAVERLSHGSIRIDFTWAGNQPAYEGSTVRSVLAGKYDLGAVGARVWDAFGVTSFRALVAPFLIRNLELEQRVLASPLANRMLQGLEHAGVVGLAVLPGPLRRPLGVSRPLVAARDYRRATIAIRLGGVTRTTFHALGANAKPYVVGRLPHLDGAELDVNTIAENGYDSEARALTTNVVYWPRPQTFFASREVFERLTPSQQAILRAAGRAALAPELARVQRDEATSLAGICGRGAVRLLTASASELAGLRRAVQPVYATLQRDTLTRRLLAQIEKLAENRGAGVIDTVECPKLPSDQRLAARLNGTWQATAGMSDLLAAGVPPDEAERQRGTSTLTFHAGRWRGSESVSGFVWGGRYLVQGNLLRLVSNTCPRADPCPSAAITTFAWSVYEDRLSLDLVSGTARYYGLYATPLTRVS